MNFRKINLRCFRFEDAVRLQEYRNDPDISACIIEEANSRDPILFTLEDANAFIHMSRARASSGRTMAIDVNCQLAGCISWEYGAGIYEMSAEIGYWVAHEFRGQGIATAAIKLSAEFIFQKRRLLRACARVTEDNVASKKALERAGFIHEATLRNAVTIAGETRNCLVYACFADE